MALLKYSFELLLLLASNLSFAGLITYGGYTLNEETNIVTDTSTDLEWLQWDVTVGMSISEAMAAYAPDGWELATNVQMASLFEAFGFNSTTEESVSITTFGSYIQGSDDTPYDMFITLMGTTHILDPTIFTLHGDGFDAYRWAGAFFGNDLDNDSSYNQAIVSSDFTYNSRNYPAHAALYEDGGFTTSDSIGSYGVALVRTVDVPVPSTLVIFALGILGLGMHRKVRG